MASIHLGTVLLVIAICVVLAIIGTVLAGDALTTWYPTLAKPWFQIPLWAFVGVDLVGYVMDAVILYRLITYVSSTPGKVVTISAMLVMMVYNELWNGAFFRSRSALVGFISLIAFFAPLLIVQIALSMYDGPSAGVLLIYVLWYLLYDVPWAYALWRLNPA